MISWESGGNRLWSSTGEDCLAVRWSRADSDAVLTLHEGNHHYFSELSQYDESDQELMRHPLTGPGPFEIQLSPDNPGRIRVKAHFTRYPTLPFSPGESHISVSCGFLDRQDTREDICMTVHRDAPQEGRTRSSLPPPQDHKYPTLLRAGDHPREALILSSTCSTDTLVWFVQSKFQKEESSEARIKVGGEFPLNTIVETLASVKVAKNTLTPQTPSPASSWNLAVPVRETSLGKGIFGRPLIHREAEPVKNFRLRFQGTEIRASWEWTLPLPWMDILLWWYISRDPEGLDPRESEMMLDHQIYLESELTEEWAEYYQSNQKVDVDWLYYQRFSSVLENPGTPRGSVRVNLPIDRRTLRQRFRGCALSVIACPRLFGEPLPEHQKDAFVYL